jgi:hypothetical protein
MIKLKKEQVIEYFHRSYTAVDGLWFARVEDSDGFEVALRTDEEVWKVLPKIQARMLKSMGKVGPGMAALRECLTTKLTLEGFIFKTEDIRNGDGFRVNIEKCPWHDLLVKANREHLSGKVGSVICNTEYSAWATEFDDKIRFELPSQICRGAPLCVLQFTHAGS